jgi:uncharacterized membrane-anchored protein
LLPTNHASRLELHAEIHARPHARIRIPALVTNVSVLSAGVGIDDELAVLRQLPGQAGLTTQDMRQNFMRLRIGDYTVKWERHGEFTRYSITQPLPGCADWGAKDPQLSALLRLPEQWLQSIPGQTISATQLALIGVQASTDENLLASARQWLGSDAIVAARIGAGYATAFTDFRLRDDGFCRYVAVAEHLTETRAGRVSSRLLELEIYRMLALMGLPIARSLGPLLKESEVQLADITTAMENAQHSDSALLHQLITLAARVEGATAAHSFRFAATTAYQNLVRTRIDDLHEVRLPGVQTFSEFLNRRFLPAMATVEATHKRLTNLSERIERSSALIRTRADIVREEQNQKLLEKLTDGQRLQLRMQQTVEGLSIAAISYYTLSLLVYGFKAAKAAGLQINTDIATGVAVPLVVAAVAYFTSRIRRKLHQ